jgi:site-specific DNA recombinase
MTTAMQPGPAPTSGLGPAVVCDILLRLSDARIEEALSGREAKLRAAAAAWGWTVRQVVIENDIAPDGRLLPASAFKKRRIRTPSGRIQLRVIRPKFRQELDDLAAGRIGALLAEDLDRVCRDPRDLEDLIEACELSGGSAVAVSGSLSLTNGGTSNERAWARNMVNMAQKSSEDTSRRVTAARERLAGQSYGGGARPYGYQIDEHTEKFHRNLVVDEAEAAELRRIAAEVLRGVTLAACARDLRERRVATARGGTWTPELLVHVLGKPAIAGLARKDGALVEAPWEPILPLETWKRLCQLFDERRGRNGNEPRWLLSGFATCGVCGSPVKANGHGRYGHSYQCRARQHVRRSAERLDDWVKKIILGALDRDKDGTLRRPPPRDDVDKVYLRAEVKRLTLARKDVLELLEERVITKAESKRELRKLARELAPIEAQLVASADPDPLEEFRPENRGRLTVWQVWDGVSMARRRAVVQELLTSVTINRARKGGLQPRPIRESVEVVPNGWELQEDSDHDA